MTIDCPRIVSVNYLNDTNLSPVDHNGFKMTDTTGGFSLSVDGTVVSVGDLLLLINQTNEEENGLWQIVQQGNSLDTPWQLCRVHPGGKLFVGMLFFIKSGTDWANTMWCLSQAQENATDVEVITSGVSLLTFTQVCVNKPSGTGCSPINNLIDNTGATATDIVVDVSTPVMSFPDVDSRLTLINNNFADLVGKVNAILTCLRDQNILNTP